MDTMAVSGWWWRRRRTPGERRLDGRSAVGWCRPWCSCPVH